MENKNNQPPVGPWPDAMTKLLLLREHEPGDVPRLAEGMVDRLGAHIERYGRRREAEIILEQGRFKATAFSVEDDSTHWLCEGTDAGLFVLVTELHPCAASTARGRGESG